MMYKSTDHGSDDKILFHGGFVCVIFYNTSKIRSCDLFIFITWL